MNLNLRRERERDLNLKYQHGMCRHINGTKALRLRVSQGYESRKIKKEEWELSQGYSKIKRLRISISEGAWSGVASENWCLENGKSVKERLGASWQMLLVNSRKMKTEDWPWDQQRGDLWQPWPEWFLEMARMKAWLHLRRMEIEPLKTSGVGNI